MNTLEIKNKIVSNLNSIEDSTLLESVLSFVENLKEKSGNLSKSQLNDLNKRRATYLAGNAEITNWQTIKRNLKQKHGL